MEITFDSIIGILGLLLGGGAGGFFTWRWQRKKAKAEAETLRDAIKQEMLNRDTEELSAGQYIVRWTSVLSQRFDTTAFKKVMPEVYKAYTKQVSSKRFTISA